MIELSINIAQKIDFIDFELLQTLSHQAPIFGDGRYNYNIGLTNINISYYKHI